MSTFQMMVKPIKDYQDKTPIDSHSLGSDISTTTRHLLTIPVVRSSNLIINKFYMNVRSTVLKRKIQ